MIHIANKVLSNVQELMEYGYWEDESTLDIFELYVMSSLFSKTVKTYAIYDDETVATNHVSLLNTFISLDESLLQEIKEKLWEHCEYHFYAVDYGADFEGQTNYEFFNIFTLEDAYDNSNLHSVMIDTEDNTCKITFYPEWEDEHGFTIEMVEGKLIFESYDGDIYKDFHSVRSSLSKVSESEDIDNDDGSDDEEDEEIEVEYTQTNLEIKNLVKQLTFDDDMSSFSDRFTKEHIIEALLYENTLPSVEAVLPEDYIWYMQNYGSAYFEFGSNELLAKYNDDIYINVNVLGLHEPVDIYRRYAYHTRTGSYSYRMEDINSQDNKFILEKKYMPITSDSSDLGGGMVVMDIEDVIGSIWRVPPQIEFIENNTIDYLTPQYLAENFTEFIRLLSTYSKDSENLKESGFERGSETTTYHLWRKV